MLVVLLQNISRELSAEYYPLIRLDQGLLLAEFHKTSGPLKTAQRLVRTKNRSCGWQGRGCCLRRKSGEGKIAGS